LGRIFKSLEKLIKFLILWITFLTLITGCSKIESEKSINFAIAQKPQNLDPRFQSDAASEKVSELIFSSLFYFDKHYQPQSSLVNWQKISSLKYIFFMKEQLPLFHHKKELDVDDIIATINNLRSLKISPYYIELKNIRNIKKLSKKTFEIELLMPEKNFLSRLNFSILPSDLLINGHNFSQNPIGSGPFVFVSNKPNLLIKRQNDSQLVKFIHIQDSTVRALKLIKGEVDLIQNDLPLEMINLLNKKNNLTTILDFGTNISYIGFNFNDSILKLKSLRRAISLGIDRRSLIKFFLNDKTRIAEQILPPEHWASEKLKTIEFNPKLAKEIIDQLNLTAPIVLTYKTSTDPFRVKIATLIQKQLSNIGVKLIIKSLDWGTFFRDIQEGNFQLYGLTWVGIRNPDIYEKIFHSKMVPPNGLNRSKYNDLDTDTLLMEAKTMNIWSKAINKIHEDNVFLPLWYEGNFAAFSHNISHYHLHNDASWDALKTVRKKNGSDH